MENTQVFIQMSVLLALLVVSGQAQYYACNGLLYRYAYPGCSYGTATATFNTAGTNTAGFQQIAAVGANPLSGQIGPLSFGSTGNTFGSTGNTFGSTGGSFPQIGTGAGQIGPIIGRRRR